jgi:hypothetical protein
MTGALAPGRQLLSEDWRPGQRGKKNGKADRALATMATEYKTRPSGSKQKIKTDLRTVLL